MRCVVDGKKKGASVQYGDGAEDEDRNQSRPYDEIVDGVHTAADHPLTNPSNSCAARSVEYRPEQVDGPHTPEGRLSPPEGEREGKERAVPGCGDGTTGRDNLRPHGRPLFMNP